MPRALPRSLLWSLALAGCYAEIDSPEIDTGEMSAEMRIVSHGTGTAEAAVELFSGDSRSRYVRLDTAVDTLELASGSTAALFTLDDALSGQLIYRTSLAGDGAETAFRVGLTRAGKASAPSSTVTLPPPYEVSSPGPADTYRTADGGFIPVKWSDKSADPMVLQLSGPCILPASASVDPSKGGYDWPLAAVPRNTGAAQRSCEVTLTVERQRAGMLDPAFGQGGSLVAVARRAVTFTLDTTPGR